MDRASHTAVYQDTYGDGDNHAEENAEEDRETNSHTYYGCGKDSFSIDRKTVNILTLGGHVIFWSNTSSFIANSFVLFPFYMYIPVGFAPTNEG